MPVILLLRRLREEADLGYTETQTNKQTGRQ